MTTWLLNADTMPVTARPAPAPAPGTRQLPVINACRFADGSKLWPHKEEEANVRGRVAVVTGAGRGIGQAVAERLAADGLRVVAVDVDGAAAEKTAAMVGGVAHECDVSQPDSVRAVAERLDRLDVLVNNAGVWQFSPLAQTTSEQFQRVMGINVLGTLLCLQTLAPLLSADGGGAVVNLSSVVADQPQPGFGIYPASKAAIAALTRQAAIEYAPEGIRVNAVSPGLVQTEGTEGIFGTEEQIAALEQLLPQGRLGSPADIADVVAFLASEAARHVTGQVLTIDGGLGRATFSLLWKARNAAA
jgi:NAD(P)-dependent dehydrogenase (short-subunit alcohol dehydrogenase family)